MGATGTVGSQIAELMGERGLHNSELKLFGHESAGRVVEVGKRSLPVAHLKNIQELSPFDIVFLAIPRGVAAEIIAAQPGPILIDLSAACASPGDVAALVAPGLSPRDWMANSGPGKIFEVPHPAAQLIATILQALRSDGFAGASIMLSASAAGHEGVSALFQQSVELLNARLDLDDEPQVAFNVFVEQRARELARAFVAQIRVLGVDASRLVLDIVRVPAFHGSAVALFLPANEARREWADCLRSAPGLILVANDDAAGFIDVVGQDGAITRMFSDTGGVVIWSAFDAARRAALSAIWVAETLSGRGVSG